MLSWCTSEVCRNGEVMAKLRAEGKGLWSGGAAGAVPNRVEDLSKLTYAEQCLREALRRHSVLPTVTRSATCDVVVDGVSYAKGTTFMVGVEGAHMDKEYWPNPEVFDPERFTNFDDVKPFTFLPFIDGPRNCLGQYIALLESKIILSKLVHCYDLELKSGGVEKDGFVVPVVPKGGVMVGCCRRN